MKSKKGKLQEYIDKYKKKLRLEKYEIEYFIADEYHWVTESDKTVSVKRKSDYYAQVEKCGNRSFSIIFNKSALTNNLREIVIHELLHIVNWSMTEIPELIIMTSNDFCDAGKENMLEKLSVSEHELIEKMIPLVK